MEQIKNVKGIGEKRLAQIEAAVGTLFTGKEDTTERVVVYRPFLFRFILFVAPSRVRGCTLPVAHPS